jgi:hypothetical protein
MGHGRIIANRRAPTGRVPISLFSFQPGNERSEERRDERRRHLEDHRADADGQPELDGRAPERWWRPHDGSLDGDRATWKVDITRPLALTVTFEATISGDSISGTAEAGMFPPSPFRGSRA